MPNTTVLIISPHPDDLEIGMGGTAAKLLEKGDKVISLIVTDGRNSSNNLGVSKDELADIRKNEVSESSKELGISDLITFDIPEIKSDKNKKLYEDKLNNLLDETKPDEIYIPHLELDKHETHKITSSIAVNLIEDKGINCSVWCYEVWSSFPYYDRLEDISSYIDKKIDSIKQHKSQIEYKDYVDGIVGLNRYRAVFRDFYEEESIDYAEVFIKLL